MDAQCRDADEVLGQRDIAGIDDRQAETGTAVRVVEQRHVGVECCGADRCIGCNRQLQREFRLDDLDRCWRIRFDNVGVPT